MWTDSWLSIHRQSNPRRNLIFESVKPILFLFWKFIVNYLLRNALVWLFSMIASSIRSAFFSIIRLARLVSFSVISLFSSISVWIWFRTQKTTWKLNLFLKNKLKYTYFFVFLGSCLNSSGRKLILNVNLNRSIIDFISFNIQSDYKLSLVLFKWKKEHLSFIFENEFNWISTTPSSSTNWTCLLNCRSAKSFFSSLSS